ncbi:hypothetical protein GCM10009841_23130 [Microlunatus panaciterrae]|uniref:Macrocin-O-methyltransferase (TylF) n=1 Tax=Microlunatus panaciterrae TaxID=400768 RepID=A0ABS2RDW6_9ACTN|nr:TylF/MycF/NovP-related O-methyltransferase [Microlunatus panaciterrae]MBM7797195.1 hypothetical protein [Microlunatus panaciterrae]
MGWRRRVNQALNQATGYSLVRTVDLHRLRRRAERVDERAIRERRRLEAVEARLAQTSEALGRQVERIGALTKPKPKPPAPLPADYDDEFKAIWPLVKDRTMNTHEKLYYLYSAVRYVEAQAIPGAFVECGVWRGGSMLAAARTLELLGTTERDLYLFDTFSGMTEPDERDVHVWAKKSATEILSSDDTTAAKMFIPASLDDVRAGFDELSYPPGRIHYVEGPVEETIPDRAPEQIAILRLDTDWYASTRHELDTLYHRLAPGGVLIIDDYGSWQGSRDATDEFLANTGEPLLLTRVSRTRAAVKPGLTTRVAPGSSPF